MNREEEKRGNEEYPSNKDKQDIDKTPGEGRGEGEQVTKADFTSKKVDADPERPYEQPIRQLP